METTTLSTGHQFVIPRAIRDRLGLRPGTKRTVLDEGLAMADATAVRHRATLGTLDADFEGLPGSVLIR